MPAEATRFALRLPVGLHAQLVAEAARQGVSLNALIVALLAGGIAWRQQDPTPEVIRP